MVERVGVKNGPLMIADHEAVEAMLVNSIDASITAASGRWSLIRRRLLDLKIAIQ